MDIIDSGNWLFDESGRSPAFVSLNPSVSVSREMIEYLKKISGKERKNVRFCLNPSPESELQDMIILEYKEKKCRIPHKHTDGNEAIHLIEGRIRALIFDDFGNLIDDRILEKEGEFAYRNAQNRQHLYFPLTDIIVMREIRGGKFDRKNLVPANWNLRKILGAYLSNDELTCYNTECKSPCDLFYHH